MQFKLHSQVKSNAENRNSHKIFLSLLSVNQFLNTMLYIEFYVIDFKIFLKVECYKFDAWNKESFQFIPEGCRMIALRCPLPNKEMRVSKFSCCHNSLIMPATNTSLLLMGSSLKILRRIH